MSQPVRQSDGDVASLGDTFNKMIQQLKSQRNQLLTAQVAVFLGIILYITFRL